MAKASNDRTRRVSGPEAAELPPAKALDVGLRHHQAGRLDDARAIYERVLERVPDHGLALHLLGAIHYQTGRPDLAIDLMTRSRTANPRSPELHTHLGEAYRVVGRYDEAIDSCRRALELRPVQPDALNTLGAALTVQGKPDEAVAALEDAIEYQPNHAEAHANLGNALRALEDHERAVAAYERALEINPGFTGALAALGTTRQAQGRPEEAAACYRRVLESNSDDATTLTHLGATLRSLGKTDEAVSCLRKAVRLRPDFAAGHTNLGTALLARGELDEAIECYRTGLERKRGMAPESPERLGGGEHYDTFRFTTAHKLRHDIEQFDYLMRHDRLPPSFSDEVDAYKSLLADIAPSGRDNTRVPLATAQAERIGRTYNRIVHIADTPALNAGSLNASHDVAAIEADYKRNAPGVTVVDDLLTGEALAALRRFCLESTIWYDFSYPGGCLGADLSEGFGCGLLFQIVEDLRTTFPGIFGAHELRQMWAYKYDSTMRAIPTDADAAAINVNFWITPDDANLDSDSGGLVVYQREAPLEWDFAKYNNDQDSIADYLKGSESVTVPHRQNRAVIFNSNQFHKSDAFRFKEGYENRRINITIQFGFRPRPDVPRP